MRWQISHWKWDRLYPGAAPLVITSIYVALGVMWIFFSDHLLEFLVDDPVRLTQLQTFKGWFYIALTAYLLYFLIRQSTQMLQRSLRDLRHSEARYRFLAEAMPQIVWTSLPNGEVTYTNQRWSLYTGSPSQESALAAWERLLHPEDRDRCLQEWLTTLKTGQPYSCEGRFLRSDHCYRWHLQRAFPMRDDQGQITMWVGTATDIEDLKQAEAEILRFNQTLEQRVRDRTAQLEAINQELDSFSYSVSHDLRAPLRHISGFVSILETQLSTLQASDHPDIHHSLQIIQSSTQKMGQLIDGLLTLSHVGRQPLVSRPVPLRPLVENAIALVQAQAQALQELDALSPNPNIEMTLGELPVVLGDAVLLEQVFTNLIDNAFKFSRDRHPIQIHLGTLPDGTLFIQDNGIGFPPEATDQLFGAFQRLHPTQQFAGTGIGLAIVQRIITRHNGTIWATGQPHQGATFYLKLPLAPLPAKPDDP